jgi:hypothetical protein
MLRRLVREGFEEGVMGDRREVEFLEQQQREMLLLSYL